MRKYLVTILLITISINTFSQLTKGLIIRGKDTIKVNFNIPIYLFSGKINYFKIQRKIKFYDEKGKKGVVKSSEANEIQLFYNDEIIRMLTQIDPIQVPCEMCTTKYIFLKLVLEGEVKLFKYYFSEGGGHPIGMKSAYYAIDFQEFYYYYQKGVDKIFSPNDFYFKKEMTEYFFDCEELVKKIEFKEYRKEDAIKIVEFYNSNCMK